MNSWFKKQIAEYRSWPKAWRQNAWLNVLWLLCICGWAELAWHSHGLLNGVAILALQLLALIGVNLAFHFWRKLYIETLKTKALEVAIRDVSAGEIRKGFQEFLMKHPALRDNFELEIDGTTDAHSKWKH